jgi:hypothetical protein
VTSCITDTRSRRLPISLMRGVAEPLYHRCMESSTLCITDTGIFSNSILNSDSPMRGVNDSPYHRYEESSTPHITNMRSRWLPVSPICGVAYSPYHRYWESCSAWRCNLLTMCSNVPTVAVHPYYRVLPSGITCLHCVLPSSATCSQCVLASSKTCSQCVLPSGATC